jgi:hypothetical protein
MDVSSLLPHASDLAGWARIAFVQMVALGIVEIIGENYGPLVKPRWPSAYAFLAATWRIVRQVFSKLPRGKSDKDGAE